MRALEAALNAVWAMEEGALETLLTIAAREHEVTPEALEAYRAKSLANAERLSVRKGVAILDVRGPLFKRANLFTEISGATSYEQVRRDFQRAIDDPDIRGVLLNIDSPGGEANGTAELAGAIYGARGTKPIHAYVGGMGASAAYWLASAADRVVADPLAMLGSIGVQMGYRVAAPRPGEKSIRFVSSQSPMKNADPETEEGAKAMQATVDAMAQVFVEAVARNRGVAVETVLKDFGQGGIFVGAGAVDAGLADALGDFESVLADLSAARPKAASSGRSPSKARMQMDNESGAPAAETSPEVTTEAAAVAQAQTAPQAAATEAPGQDAIEAAVKAERQRIADIRRFGAAFGATEAAISTAIESGSSLEAFSRTLAEAEEARKAAKVSALAADEEALDAPAASTGRESEGTSASDLVKRIIASARAVAGDQ